MTHRPNMTPDDLTEFLARIGHAFDGIESVNTAGRTEKLSVAIARLGRQNRIPLNAATLAALADRINALTVALDAHGSSWGGPGVDTGRPTIIPSIPRDTITDLDPSEIAKLLAADLAAAEDES